MNITELLLNLHKDSTDRTVGILDEIAELVDTKDAFIVNGLPVAEIKTLLATKLEELEAVPDITPLLDRGSIYSIHSNQIDMISQLFNTVIYLVPEHNKQRANDAGNKVLAILNNVRS